MVSKKPLVNYSGVIKEIASTDTIPVSNGGVPVGGTAGQVLSKIDATDNNVGWTTIASTALATGAVIESYSTPSNTLELNGQAVSRTTYADLFALIGITYGAGNGTTTFNVPTSVAGLLTFKAYTSGTALTATRYSHTATLLNDSRVLLCGGSVAGVTSTSILFLTISGNIITYATGTSLPDARSIHTATLLSDGRVLLCGGYLSSGTTATTVFLTISGNTITYVAGTALPATRYSHTATLLSDGRLLLCGGAEGAGYPSTGTLFLTISGNVITYVAGTVLPSALYSHTATLISDGRLLLCGGNDASSNTLSATLFLTLTNNTITYVAGTNLPSARTEHMAVLLSDGRILLCSGNSPAVTASTVYLTILNNAVVSSVGTDLPTAQAYGTAVVFNDSRVLLCGGYNGTELTNTLFVSFLNSSKKYIKI